MAYDFNLGGQGALTGAIGGSALGPIGAIGGGLLGALGGIEMDQSIPDFNASEQARSILERFGGFDNEQKQIESNADTVKRRTMAELISGGADPASARRIAEDRATSFRSRAMGDLIDSFMQQEESLVRQLLPVEIQRGEDQASLSNLQSAQRQEGYMSWAPTLLGAGLLAQEQGWFNGGADTTTNMDNQIGLRYKPFSW